MMSAPSGTRRLACASACSGARCSPPSEKESGVTLSTPITAGTGPDNSFFSSGWTAIADVTGLEGAAIMPWLCAVGAGESRHRRRLLGAFGDAVKAPAIELIADLGLQLAGLRDHLL